MIVLLKKRKEDTLTDVRKLTREFFGLFLLFWAMLILLSLITHDMADPSLNHVVSSSAPVLNDAGLLGAYISGFLNDVFGIASYVWPLVVGAVGAACISPAYELVWWRWIGYFLMTICFLCMGTAWDVQFGHIRGGGMIGNAIYAPTARLLSPGGSALLWLFIFVIALELAFGISWLNIFKKVKAMLSARVRITSAKPVPHGEASAALALPPRFSLQNLCDKLSRPKARAIPEMCLDVDAVNVTPALSTPKQEEKAEAVPAQIPVEDTAASLQEVSAPLKLREEEGLSDAAQAVPEMPQKGQSAEAVVTPLSEESAPDAAEAAPTESTNDASHDVAEVATEPATEVATEPATENIAENISQSAHEVSHSADAPRPPDMLVLDDKSTPNIADNADAHYEPKTDTEMVPDIVSTAPATTAVADGDDDDFFAPTAAPQPLQNFAPTPPITQEESRGEDASLSAPSSEHTSTTPDHSHDAPDSTEHVAAVAERDNGDADIESVAAAHVIDDDAVATVADNKADSIDINTPTESIKSTPAPQSSWVPLPSLDLLQFGDASVYDDGGEREARGKALMSCLADFNIQGELVRITPGPVVTMYEVRPAAGIRVARFSSLSDDIALALKAIAVRIQAPIPGSDTVGIEIPNRQRDMVNFREILESSAFQNAAGPLSMALGKDISGRPYIADLSRMPHLLVAGATGAGKSVGLNSILLSLLYTTYPERMQLLLIDPKRIELAVYADLPHLVHPVVTEMQFAKNALEWAVHEMDQRYAAMARLSVRNIAGYNDKINAYGDNLPPDLADLQPMTYLVIVIDELADLMLTAAREVETSIVRLAQLARAAGIHMILATQRPSVNVVTGIIKANFPCRISFQVTSAHDSRTILDLVGAERLLGKGDMLFKPSGDRPLRLHGPFVPDEEVQAVVEHWKKYLPPAYKVDFAQWGADEALANVGAGSATSSSNDDALYGDVRAFVEENGKASTSLIQRRFKIGFVRAARLMDQLEMDGIIGPVDGSKPRVVIGR